MQNQHALRTPPDPAPLLRYLDLVVLALALPLFAVAGLPLLGYAGAAGAWLAQRAIGELLRRRAAATGDPRRVTAVLGMSMIVRGWFLLLCILLTGLSDRDAGLSAALLAVVLVTAHLTTVMLAQQPSPAGSGR
jgi:hypothetical protein